MPALQTLYRPKTLDNFFGNLAVIKSFEKVLSRQNPPDAYLFTGASGCGKTTLARIAVRKLGCLDIDIEETNASDDRGIDSIRAIREVMRKSPLSGTNARRAIILDEAHMLTKPAQEALLKMLEEPSSNFFFCVCTTNPEALKDTFKRRCHHFHLAPIQNPDIINIFKKVLAAEKIPVAKFTKNIISKICELSSGSPGIALKLLDQIMDLDNEEEMLAVLSTITTSADDVTIMQLCGILTSSQLSGIEKWKKISPLLQNMDADGETERRIVLSWMSRRLTMSGDPLAAAIILNFKDNFYDSGKAGFITACYYSCHLGDK